MPERKKRKYTFRKNELIPYPSGSLIHEEAKAQRKMARGARDLFGLEPERKRKRR